MSGTSLDGVTVLVTRPREQADRLCALIEQCGGTALRFPGLEILPVPNAAAANPAGGMDIVVFVSLNAVAHGIDLLPKPGSPMPAIAAVGPSTARALRDHGYDIDIEPVHGFSSEALLAETAMKLVADHRILIVRGRGGRDLLRDVLTERGASVSYAEVYERQAPTAADATLLRAMLGGQVNAATATSVEILCNIDAAFEGMAHHALLDTQLVTISNRVVQKAAELGFKKPAIVAAGPDDRALLAALVEWRASLPASPESRGIKMTEPKSASTDAGASEHGAPGIDNDDVTAEGSQSSQTDPVIGSGADDHADDAAVARPAADGEADRDATDTGQVDAVTAARGPAQRRRGGWAVGWLALLLSLGALAFAGWTWWQQRALPAQLQAQSTALAANATKGVAALERRVDDLGAKTDRLARLDASIARLGERIDDSTSAIERIGGRLTSAENSVDALRGVSTTARQAWIRAETEYFLETANQSLALVGDPDVALTALENADDRLQQLGDPGLSRTRAVLADEIVALRAVPRVDIERIVHDLGSLAARVDSFAMDTERPDFFRGGEPGTAEGEGAMNRALSAVKNSVGGMFNVRRSDGKVTPLLAPQEVFFLRRNLELQLQAARLAVLRGHKANFQESLRAARSWLDAYFDTGNAGVAAAIETLTRLEAADIDPAMPDISGSLRQLRAAPKAVGETP